jgi:hypothetical protein
MRRTNCAAWTLAEHMAGHRLHTPRTAAGFLIACGYPRSACELLAAPEDRETLAGMLRDAGFDPERLPEEWPEAPSWRHCTRTPWGEAIGETAVAPGITRVETACHGGFVLSRERWDAMPEWLREFSQTRDQHFEEDGAAAAVVLAWGEHFTEGEIEDARCTASMLDGAAEHHARNAARRWDPETAAALPW